MTEQARIAGTAPHERQVARLFDTKAATWRDKYSPGGPLTARLAHLSGEVLGHVRPGGCVLDLGCGTADLARSLAVMGMRVVGCDISSPMLSAAAAADPGHTVALVRLAPGWRRLPFLSGTFDAVVISSVLEYTADPAAVLRESARVARPGGVVLATVPDPRHPVRWLEWALRGAALARWAGSRGAAGGPRWQGYLAYLSASRQRHCLRWWLMAGRQAGLSSAPCRAGGRLPALRLLAFNRMGATEGRR